MCLPFDCVTEAQLIMSATELHLHSRASHPRKHTLLYLPLLWQANQSIQVWCCRSDTHKVCGCAPFVHLITKAARNTRWLQKQVVCSERRQNRKQGKKIWNIHWTKWVTWPRWGQLNIRGEKKPAAFQDSRLILKAGMFLNQLSFLSFHPIIGNTAPKCGTIKQKQQQSKRTKKVLKHSGQCWDAWEVVEPFWGSFRPVRVHSQTGNVGLWWQKPVSEPSRRAVGQPVACGAAGVYCHDSGITSKEWLVMGQSALPRNSLHTTSRCRERSPCG